MPGRSISAHNKSSLVARAHRLKPTASPIDPLARAEAEAWVTQVEVELRLTLAEALLLDLEAERARLDAELAKVGSERDAWKVLATWLLLAPKRPRWSFFS
jgi:hypothetical protein